MDVSMTRKLVVDGLEGYTAWRGMLLIFRHNLLRGPLRNGDNPMLQELHPQAQQMAKVWTVINGITVVQPATSFCFSSLARMNFLRAKGELTLLGGNFICG